MDILNGNIVFIEEFSLSHKENSLELLLIIKFLTLLFWTKDGSFPYERWFKK